MRYLDSSAIVKLVADEPETQALVAALGPAPDALSSGLAVVEVLRAVRRAMPRRLGRAEAVLDGIALVTIDRGILQRAAGLEPPDLRALEAIHLATALSLDELDAFVTYDERLARAARAAGLRVMAPA